MGAHGITETALEFEGSRDPPALLCEEQDYSHTPASPSQNALKRKKKRFILILRG